MSMSFRTSHLLPIALSASLFAALGSLVLSVGAYAQGAKNAPAKERFGMPLVYFNDFEMGAGNWEHSDSQAWKLIEQNGNHAYAQFKHIETKTPVRSPFNRGLVKDLFVGDFVLDVKLQSTVRDYDHRSLCLFFGFQDPAHLYYVHFGKKTDDHANQIFIVNNADRLKISTETTPGTNWTDGWHHARIVRKVETGTIEVYFDDMEKPVMKAVDDRPVWSIICFVVPSEYRGQGVAQALLAAAVDYARKQGATLLEAYPVDKPGRSSDDSMWFGTKSMYDAAGFVEVARRKPQRPVVRFTPTR
jgi:GNAT superfamily N-acetyltransferase